MSNGPVSPDARDANSKAKAIQAYARSLMNDPAPRKYNGPPPLNGGKPRIYNGPPGLTGQRIQDH